MKRGGSKMAYTEQFNLLSPCYKDGEQRASDFRIGGAKAKPTKKGKTKKPSTTKKVKKVKKVKKATSSKQRGGSSCGASPSVAEMGVVDNPPASLPKSYSQDAFLERYSNNIMKGGLNTNIVAVPPNGNTLTKPNQVNNVSTYLNKLKDVVFDKDTTTGFAIVVERTTEHPSNSKQDKYNIKVIETKNNTPPSMTVLTDQLFSDILNTVKNKPFEVFPKKNTTAPIINNKNRAVNYNIPVSPQPEVAVPPANANATGGRKPKNNHK
jgi:hypothetical protein